MKKVWSKQLCDEMNITAAFVYKCKFNRSAKLRLAASNTYQIYVDNHFLAYGPMRSARGYSNVREYEISDLAESNEINLTVIVAGYQVNTFSVIDEKPFFAAEVYADGELIADTYGFAMYHLDDRIQKAHRYSFQRTFVESYRFDGRRGELLTGKFEYPALDMVEVSGNVLLECELSEPNYFGTLGRLIEHGSAETDENRRVYSGRFIENIGPDYRGFYPEQLEENTIAEACRIATRPDTINRARAYFEKGYHLYDFDSNLTGFLGLSVSVPAHAVIYVLFDEIIGEEFRENKDFASEARPIVPYRLDCANVLKWELDEGEYELMSFEPYTMRYAKIVVLEGGASVEDVELVQYENPDMNLSFKSKDRKLNKIFWAARETFAQNAVDVLTDCPSRERAGWLCDSYFTARAEKFVTGANRVEKNFLTNYLLAPDLPENAGMLPMCYPSDFLDKTYIPNWSMWFVVELLDYRRRTGDDALVQKLRGKVYKLFVFLDRYLNAEGFLERLDSWVFVEWSKANEFVQDVNFPTNMLYAEALRCASVLYCDDRLADRARALKQNIIEFAYNGDFFADNAVRENGQLKRTENTTETCQYYAFYTGVASKEDFPRLYDVMFTEFGPKRNFEKTYPNVYPSNAFIGNFLRLDYLFKHGEGKQALEECSDYLGYMADRTCTLWEHDKPQASCNHGFASLSLNFIVTSLSGLKDFDTSAKTVTVTKPVVDTPARLTLRLDDGAVKIRAGKGKLRVKLPKGYTLIQE